MKKIMFVWVLLCTFSIVAPPKVMDLTHNNSSLGPAARPFTRFGLGLLVQNCITRIDRENQGEHQEYPYDLDTLKKLVKLGADLNVTSPKGQSLFDVCWRDHEMRRYLLNQGVVPIFSVIESNNHELIQILLQDGIALNAVSKDGFTPLRLAIMLFETQKISAEIVWSLLDHGALRYEQTQNQKSMLDFICSGKLGRTNESNTDRIAIKVQNKIVELGGQSVIFGDENANPRLVRFNPGKNYAEFRALEWLIAFFPHEFLQLFIDSRLKLSLDDLASLHVMNHLGEKNHDQIMERVALISGDSSDSGVDSDSDDFTCHEELLLIPVSMEDDSKFEVYFEELMQNGVDKKN